MGKTTSKPRIRKINNVKIRMYCLGTGDCFIVKFCAGETAKFTMMIDCGSCQGTVKDFEPYITDLARYVNNNVDLLIITHEHNDHVNGFAKCYKIFENTEFKIKQAWFAWTEDPDDPDGYAKELQRKRKKMKMALQNAFSQIEASEAVAKQEVSDDYYFPAIRESRKAFINGLTTLAEINLSEDGNNSKSLPGMLKIKEILEKKKTHIRYLKPGQEIKLNNLDSFKFYILGPPYERDYIFKDGKEDVDVYRKKLNYFESSLAATAFTKINSDLKQSDIPFDKGYLLGETNPSVLATIAISNIRETTNGNSGQVAYNDASKTWRKIDNEWLLSAGTLALRLNSHINNTSLAFALEHIETRKVLLFPGDAEFGSWESWHSIKKWKKKGKNETHLVEDLLGRTEFYKVGHHLSYNGTALALGIELMPTSGLVSMATLDRRRISSGWKSTMPNKYLMQELIKRTDGRFFIMDEFEIRNAPSKTLDPESLEKKIYSERYFDEKKKEVIYKQYNLFL